jgi:RND family efflux transporter MFP subunit
VTGIVSKVYVDRGQWVKPSEKLLEIEPDRFDMAEKEAEAMLEQTLARLGIKEVPPQDFDVNQTAPVKKAQSEYDNAKSKMDRATPIHQSHTMNDFEYFDIVSSFKTAESGLEASRDDARALLAQARANRSLIDMRKKDFRDAVILAPDGTSPDGTKIESYAVTDRNVSVGEYLKEGTNLFTLMADSLLKLQARVPERYMEDVKKGATVTFHVEAYPDELFEGKVSTIDPAVDLASRTFLIEAIVDNVKYGHRLRPGSFVPGWVLTKKEASRVMVPLESVTSFVGVTKVYKLDDGGKRVRAVVVTTGQQEQVTEGGRVAQWVEIAQGDITANDTVAVSGLTKLIDGCPVIVDAARAASQAATSSRPAE